MSGEGRGKGRGAPRAAGGSRAKSGKPRPGTGGYGRRKLEGKGPTPAAESRPGHPAQRRAAAAAAAAARGRTGARGAEASPVRPAADRGSRGTGRFPGQTRGAGTAAEVVAGRNAVLESLRARVPALALHVGPRLDADDRINEAVKLAADRGIPVVEAGRSELDRLTGGAVHQGLALRIRPYAYAHPDDLLPGPPGTGESGPSGTGPSARGSPARGSPSRSSSPWTASPIRGTWAPWCGRWPRSAATAC